VRFKELLNVNTINEVANFNAQLARERETIRERIENINGSLTKIDYNASCSRRSWGVNRHSRDGSC